MLILLIIAGILLFVLLFPLALEIRIREGLSVHLRIFWFIRLALYPSKKDKAPDDKKPEAKKTEPKKEPKQEQNLLERIAEYRVILGDLLKSVRGLLGSARLRRLRLKITVTGEEPHETAVYYGAVCAAVYPMLTALSTLIKFDPGKKAHSIEITPDFESAGAPPLLHLDAVCTMIPAVVLATLLRMVLNIRRASKIGKSANSAAS